MHTEERWGGYINKCLLPRIRRVKARRAFSRMDQHAIASRKGSPQKSSAFRPGGISALRFDRFTTQKYDHPFLLPTWPWPNWASWRVRIPSDGQHFFSACAGNQTQHVMDFFDPLSMFVVWLHDKCKYSFISFHISSSCTCINVSHLCMCT